MKKIIYLSKKSLNNQKGEVSGIAVAGGLLLFSLVVMGFAVVTLNPELEAGITTVTTAIRNTFTTIGGL